MTKKEIHKFLDSHRDIELSAQKIEYSLFLYEGMDKLVIDILKQKNSSEEDLEAEMLIANANDSDQFLSLMRKELKQLNKYSLRQKLLANEDLVMSAIKERSLRNRQDLFIENVLYFFLRSKENVSDWIVTNYQLFRSEYFKSMLCIVLGFRGEVELIPFLVSEAKRFEKYYPDETYDQGPFLAVQELTCRFLN